MLPGWQSSMRAPPQESYRNLAFNDSHPTPAQPTAEKWPGSLDSTLLTSPKDGCQEPSARRMVCHIPPSSVSPTTWSSLPPDVLPSTAAQATAEKWPGSLDSTPFTSPKNGCQ